MDPDLLFALKALTSGDRLRILGAVATTPRTADALAAELGLPLARVVREIGFLRRAGLVEFDRASRAPAHALALGRLAELGRALDALERGADGGSSAGAAPDRTGLAGAGLEGEAVAREDAKVLRAFFEDGRLTTIPAHGAKRLMVLRYLRDRCFPEDREYSEKEVNQLLALAHPDVAALRRYLVDTGLMTRAAGVYRRGRGAAA